MATSMAFERSRFRMQVVIYGQQARKMACLVEALDNHRGGRQGPAERTGAGPQAVADGQLQQAQAQSQARQVEAKLRRMAGDGLPATEGLSSLLLVVPELPGCWPPPNGFPATLPSSMPNTNAARQMARVSSRCPARRSAGIWAATPAWWRHGNPRSGALSPA